MKHSRIKRVLAGMLAAVLMVHAIPVSTAAEEQTMEFIIRGDAFQNKSFSLYGHHHRSITCYYVNPVDFHVPAFCLEPGKKLPNHTRGSYTMYTAKPGVSVPGIGGFDRYLPMTLAYRWMVSGNYFDQTRYAMVQTYLWGCLAGHETDWGTQGATIGRLSQVMGEARIMTMYEEMKSFIEAGLADYEASNGSVLPSWNGTAQSMTLNGGRYELTLDISSCPKLADTVWEFPDSSWGYEKGKDGKSITFFYNGQTPSGTIRSAVLNGIGTEYYAYIFQPDSSLQMQMGWLDMAQPETRAAFSVGTTPVLGVSSDELVRYRHQEIFESNYQVEVEKYCAETGQPLEDSVFRVWEAFDFGQICTDGYEEGNPDGSTGQVYENCMSPAPKEEYLCGEITTDADGRAEHRDIRSYHYSKTYCMGHPAPEWVECDHDGEEECGCEEENERLREMWKAEQEACRQSTDFHVQNEDEENREQSEAGKEAMLRDRDATYEAFINLEYSYTVEEKKARNGYILHGDHRDDQMIETVILRSAQAEAEAMEGTARGASESLLPAEAVYRQSPAPMEKTTEVTYRLDQAAARFVKEREVELEAPEEETKAPDAKLPGVDGAGAAGTLGGAGTEAETEGEKSDQEENESLAGESGKEEVDQNGGENTGKEETEKEETGENEAGGETSGGENSGGGGSEDTESPESGEVTDTGNEASGGTADTGSEVSGGVADTGSEASGGVADTGSEASEGGENTGNEASGEIQENGDSSEGAPQASISENRLRRSRLTAFSWKTLFSRDSDGDEGEISISLPPFQDDHEAPIDTSGYGDPDTCLYVFRIWDHRTEGEIFVNKRDLELYEQNPEGSYGQTQGDATLEGAVYGLFAAQDIVHPDGKSGVVYRAGELTAIATTDSEGNAAFLAYTEAPGTRLGEDHNLILPEGETGPESLYEGQTIESSEFGFGSITYPDYREINGNAWIGRPLILGSYYIQELSRSEGYELSVSGRKLSETNRLDTGARTVYSAGSAWMKRGLSDQGRMESDGSWNSFTVASYRTDRGYDITVSGYPEHTEFFRETVRERTELLPAVTGIELVQKTDADGNPVFQTAVGGELKTDSEGQPLLKEDAEEEEKTAAAETLPYHFYTAVRPGGQAAPSDASLWKKELDEVYLKEAAEEVLEQLGYQILEDASESPWVCLKLSGTTNEEGVREILDWFTEQNFYNCAAVSDVVQTDGQWVVTVAYDYRETKEDNRAVYEPGRERLFIRKGREGGHYWISCEKGEYRLGAGFATIREQRRLKEPAVLDVSLEEQLETVWQPVYERYQEGELLLDSEGNPIPVMTEQPIYEEEETVIRELELEPVKAVWDQETGIYRIHAEPDTPWTEEEAQPREDTFRAVTDRARIEYQGEELPYSQYLTGVLGAAADVRAALPEIDDGTYLQYVTLSYPGQTVPVQDAGTGNRPVQLLQRIIKQAVKVTKDISQSTYEDNTYGSVHNDPLTALLGLFGGGKPGAGGRMVRNFKFKIYLKSAIEAADRERGGALLEKKEDGSWNYRKFFDGLLAAEKKGVLGYPDRVLKQIALDYWDISGYKQEVEALRPELNSDRAYELALDRAKREAALWIDSFAGLEKRLAVAWDRRENGGADQDATTLQCTEREGKDDYYETSIMLPYGTYVIVEQTPFDLAGELMNRHFDREEPREVTLPFVPQIEGDQVFYEVGSPYFRYQSSDSPQDLIRKYLIRWNEETHRIQANGQSGTFQIYKYGLNRASAQANPPARLEISRSEEGGSLDHVIYSGYETDSGQIEIRDQVPTMTGKLTATEGKFAAPLVPWTVLAPAVDRLNPDTGNVETRVPEGEDGAFNYVAFDQEDFENEYYSSRLRIEKTDADTGDNILHSGALFKIYAAKREVIKDGAISASGNGRVLFGQAVDSEGKIVRDRKGEPLLYPRVGQDNGGQEDLPIRLDAEGIPLYDESQRISMLNEKGTRQGIFRAFTTEIETEIGGTLKKQVTGYLETPRPLGAGAYVLVEIEAPEGYAKSRPIAFEIYSDESSYYREKEEGSDPYSWTREPAPRYQYGIPVTGVTGEGAEETVTDVTVENFPSRLTIYKVEDGDSLTGNENGLLQSGENQREEVGQAFTQELTVNDRGDLLTYRVYGRKERLEERNDVENIVYDADLGLWTGTVTKALDQFSERLIEGEEQELKEMDQVKLLYDREGNFTGKGIRFDIPVSGAELRLYQGLALEKDENGSWKGMEPVYEEGQLTALYCSHTGEHWELENKGKSAAFPAYNLWEEAKQDNPALRLYRYELEELRKEDRLRENPDTGELSVLDERGNFICYADSKTGMAYVYDDYERPIAYLAGEDGEKEAVWSIMVLENGGAATIYENKRSEDDENGLPIYYHSAELKKREEHWISGFSTDPEGKQEEAAVHRISRLPFGAYILQEELPPYEQGYIQAPYQGLILQEKREEQKVFHQNEFTKSAFAKVDIRTQKEIQGAEMTLYRAKTDEEGNPVTDENGRYEKGEVYAFWISGYEYNDRGELKVDAEGQKIPTDQPHWIDHIPVGAYVLEETICPYEQGYVLSESVNVDILETGDVQSFAMEDDFTALEIRKYDQKTGETLYDDHKALLTLYRAQTDEQGEPVLQDGKAVYDEEEPILTFYSASFQEGQQVAATGRIEADPAGERPIIKYDYQYHTIETTANGRYYCTENGTTRIEYLPVGWYVLAETEQPAGYSTADPMLIQVEDKGHLVEIPLHEMGDQPIQLEVSKHGITGEKEIAGAILSIYPVDEEGNPASEPLVLHIPDGAGGYRDEKAQWESGLDGSYTEEDLAEGRIPEGFEPGDLKPHLIEYIPDGTYLLREESAPYGFLQSVDIPFTVQDQQILQKTDMTDRIPEGILTLFKADSDQPDQKIAGAEFTLENKTLGLICEKQTTDAEGKLVFRPQPIGYLGPDGRFVPYEYSCTETKAAPGYMRKEAAFEFCFEYLDEKTEQIELEYNPLNDSNRILTEKHLGDTGKLLEGVVLRLEYQEGGQWKEIETWTTGLQPHLLKGLKAGTYRLKELQTAEGSWSPAEPQIFTVRDGMTQVPVYQMKNYSTQVEIRKTDEAGAILAGARLELINKETGQTVRQWVSEAGSGQMFYGLLPGVYVIRELEPPAGYEKGAEKEITVESDQNRVQSFEFANTRIRQGGGGSGGGGTRPSAEYISFKKTNLDHQPVPGAEFTFYDRNGQVIGQSVSGPGGEFRIKKPAEGTYTFRETKVPEGYVRTDQVYSFTVSADQTVTGEYEIQNRLFEVRIFKKDGETGEPLSGAGLELWRNGERIAQGVTDSEGEWNVTPGMPGTYEIRETEPPEGYLLTEEVSSFTLSEDGTVSGSTTVYNFKKRVTLGRITASYQIRNRFGRFSFQTGERPKTGDSMPIGTLAVLSVLFLAAGIFCLKPTRKRKTKGLKLFLVGGCLTVALTVWNQTGEMTAFGQQISGDITYKEVDRSRQIPQIGWIRAKNPQSGKKEKLLFPLIRTEEMNHRWVSDLSFEIRLEDPQAQYGLTDHGIFEGQGEQELFENRELLLAQAGLDPQYYRIQRLIRQSEGVYTAEGSRMVWDCKATYGGAVSWEGSDTEGSAGEAEPVQMVLLTAAAAGLGVLMVWRSITWKKQGKRKRVFILSALMIVGGLGCAASLAACLSEYRQGQVYYERLREDTEKFLEESESDFEEATDSGDSPGGEAENDSDSLPGPDEEKLRAVNDSYLFWIRIPGTRVDYPVVRSDDSQFYLDHGFDGQPLVCGSLFILPESAERSSRNLVMYGHNMKDGSMFGELKRYIQPEFGNAHQTIEVYRNGRWYRCPIISCQVIDEADQTPCQNVFTQEQWEDYLKEMQGASLYPIGPETIRNDRILTLYTCHGSEKRVVIQAAVPTECPFAP